jgi:hypothetical protein
MIGGVLRTRNILLPQASAAGFLLHVTSIERAVGNALDGRVHLESLA